jgi:hypothetical protein
MKLPRGQAAHERGSNWIEPVAGEGIAGLGQHQAARRADRRRLVGLLAMFGGRRVHLIGVMRVGPVAVTDGVQ